MKSASYLFTVPYQTRNVSFRPPRYDVGNQAIEEFLDTHAWQVAHIRAGLAAAERGEFATDEEMDAVFNRYRQEEGTADK